VTGRRVVTRAQRRIAQAKVVDLPVAVVVDSICADRIARRCVGVERARIDERVVIVAIAGARRPTVAVVVEAIASVALRETVELERLSVGGGFALALASIAGFILYVVVIMSLSSL